MSLQREPGHLAHVVQAVAGVGVRAYLRAWHKYEVTGAERLPDGPPFVMIANHTSHLDALCLSAVLPPRQRSRVYPLAAGDTFFSNTPMAAVSALLLNALPVHRRRAVRYTLGSLREKLLAGHSVFVLFPEGTRSRTGDFAGFKAGLGRLVCATRVPVVPCWIDGAAQALPPGTRVPKRRPIRVRIGESFVLADVSDDREGWEAARQHAEQRVLALQPRPNHPA